MEMIILSEEQADIFRGPTGRGANLNPVMLKDEITWVLPCRIIDDPSHINVRDALSQLPKREVDILEFRLCEEE